MRLIELSLIELYWSFCAVCLWFIAT